MQGFPQSGSALSLSARAFPDGARDDAVQSARRGAAIESGEQGGDIADSIVSPGVS